MINVENSEENCAKAKFGHKTESVDVKARSVFKINKITTPMIKCAHGRNHYGEIDRLTNDDVTNQECPRCDETESWDHVNKCKHTKKIRVEHAKELTISLMQCKNRKVDAEEFFSFVKDMLRCLEN